MPKIKETHLQIGDFQQEIRQMKDAILHFDEVLCVKASKSEFNMTRNQLQTDFITTKEWKELNLDVVKSNDDI